MIASAYTSLSAFFADCYVPRRLLGGSPATIQQYNIAIRHFGRFLGRSPAVSDLDEDRISDFLTSFAAGHARSTLWGARNELMSLASFAQRKGLLSEVPDVPAIRPIRRVPQAYNVADIARLLAAARGTTGKVGSVPASLFWPAFFLVLYDTAARASATWALTWKDWTTGTDALLFRGETQKQRTDQLLRVSRQTAAALEAIRFPPRDLIFFWPGCRRVKYLRIKAIFRDAGLPCGRRDLLQRIRRTTLTLAHRLGVDATAQAGHSSDAITRQSYLDPSGQLQAADVLPRPILPTADPQRLLF